MSDEDFDLSSVVEKTTTAFGGGGSKGCFSSESLGYRSFKGLKAGYRFDIYLIKLSKTSDMDF